MKDKIVQIADVISCNEEPMVYGLSESGKLYQLDFDEEKLEYSWTELLESPKI